VVQLTPTGRRQFRRMAAVHEQWVIELLSGWTAEEKGQVYDLLEGLKRHLAGVDAAPASTSSTRRIKKEKSA
jgi:DNA-binding MarR family transcriptional regulator